MPVVVFTQSASLPEVATRSADRTRALAVDRGYSVLVDGSCGTSHSRKLSGLRVWM
jgi:hypothetical protein